MKLLLELYFIFAKIGCFTFGGGYAMLPMLQKEIIEKKKWSTESELMDYFAIGQVTPGIIAINTATFVGYKIKGIIGAIFATLGMITPSIIIISIIAAFIKNFAHMQSVQHAFNGIRACVCILILDAVLTLSKKSVINKVTFMIFIIVALASVTNILSSVWLVVFSGGFGFLFSKYFDKTNKSNDTNKNNGNTNIKNISDKDTGGE